MERRTNFSSLKNANAFYSDVVKWRQLAAKFWSILIIFFLVLSHSVTANHSIFNDYSGIVIGYLFHLFHLRFWSYTLFISILFWLVFILNDRLFRGLFIFF